MKVVQASEDVAKRLFALCDDGRKSFVGGLVNAHKVMKNLSDDWSAENAIMLLLCQHLIAQCKRLGMTKEETLKNVGGGWDNVKVPE